MILYFYCFWMSAWGLGSPYGERFWFFVVRAGIFVSYIVIRVDGISFPHCESLDVKTPNITNNQGSLKKSY